MTTAHPQGRLVRTPEALPSRGGVQVCQPRDEAEQSGSHASTYAVLRLQQRGESSGGADGGPAVDTPDRHSPTGPAEVLREPPTQVVDAAAALPPGDTRKDFLAARRLAPLRP